MTITDDLSDIMLKHLTRLKPRYLTNNLVVSSAVNLLHTHINCLESKKEPIVYPFNIFFILSSLHSCHNTRRSHTDIKVPDWTEYRRPEVKSPTAFTEKSEVARKIPTYFIGWLGLVGGLYCTKSHLIHYVMYMDASADVVALAKIEININDIPEGTTRIIKWRGKPLFITHRTPEQIKRERSVDLTKLRDPEHDTDRVKKDEWLVLVGVCTHLGCIPSPGHGDFDGYYCGCHGSHYDGSGRARKGPAPANLPIPEHTFSGGLLIVG